MRFPRILLAAMLSMAPLAAHADPVRRGDIEIDGTWSRATPPGAAIGVGYLTITNHGDSADRLVSARSPRVPRIEVHSMAFSQGVMEMAELPDGLELPAGSKIAMEPGSYHLMLMGIEEPIVEGEEIAVTLVFENAGEIDITMIAAAIGARVPSGTPDTHTGHGDHGD